MSSSFFLRRLGAWFQVLAIILVIGDLARGDEYDILRQRWTAQLTGGTNYDPTDPIVASRISSVTNSANSVWSTLNTSATRTFLWSDLASTSDSAHITASFGRLLTMARAYATVGSTLKGDPALKAAIISGLDWMYTYRYNTTRASYDNWWDFVIGAPLPLNDTTALMYDDLTAAQITNYMNAVNRFTPALQSGDTGANRTWKIQVLAIRGIIVKSSAKLASARDGFSSVFLNVTSGDGFYADGSFIQHDKHPYNGGYGASLLGTMVPTLSLLSDSSWKVVDPNQKNLIQWVYRSYEPLIYRGGMMAMVVGRGIAGSTYSEHASGHGIMYNILRISQFAPAADAVRIKSMVKYWAQSDSSRSFVNSAPLSILTAAMELMADPAVTPRGELLGNYAFGSMDRVVHLRPGFGLGLSMHSSRIYNYESILGVNLRGWHQADGVTYLYNGDLTHYSDAYWTTVNPRRLPGTTVDAQQPRTNASGQSYSTPTTKLNYNWVGGASLAGNGVAGMQLHGWSNTLKAKKSWFMFDNEIVCLGTQITSTDARTIETTVESRLLNIAGDNRFMVNGTAKSSTLGWAETMSGVTWAHLAGRVSGADIGYYFPTATTLKAVREARTGNFSSINSGAPSTTVTRNYLSLWFDHGKSPTNSSYAYVLLPGLRATQVADYATHPQVSVVENSASAQCVRETLLGVTAANFWNTATYTSGGITVDKKASVLVRNDGTFLDVAVSDPTQGNTGLITVTLDGTASTLISAHAGITVIQTTPTIRFTANVSGQKGKSLTARFYLRTPQTATLTPVADAYVYDGGATLNYGTSTKLAVKKGSTGANQESFLRYDLSGITGTVLSARLRLMPTIVQVPGIHAVAPVASNSWIESGTGGITWNSKPAAGANTATWTPALNTPTNADVLSPVKAALSASKLLSLRVYATTTTTDGRVIYGSRESAPANQPQLVIAIGNTPPTVAITSPEDGSILNQPGTLTLTAKAAAIGGTVAGVAFYDGSQWLGTDSTAPYSLTLSTLGGGNHRFTAVATDSNGLSTTSLPVITDVPYPPTAGAGAASTKQNTATDIDLLALVSDQDTPGAQLRFTLGTAAHGSVALLGDGHTVRFTPVPGYSGAASFNYTVTDRTPDSRLFLNYDFQSSDASDRSGNGRHGTINVQGTSSGTFPSDVPAGLAPEHVRSLLLAENGSTGATRVERSAADLNFIDANWSLTGWFKRNSITNTDSVLQLGESTGSGSNALTLVFNPNGNTLELRNYSGATQDVSLSQANVAAGVWHHFGVVRSGTVLSLYVDGILAGSDSSFNFTFDSSKPVKFGGVSTATGSATWDRWWNGALADLSIHSAALAPTDLARLMTQPSATLNHQSANSSVNLTVIPAMDTWRSGFFSTTEATGPAADDADPDADGLSNWEEYLFGTPPTTPNTRLLSITPSGSDFTISFVAWQATGPGYEGLTRKYTVERSLTLSNDWIPFASDIVGANQPITLSDTLSGVKKFYRIKVWLE